MGDYNLTSLGPREFEHLIQALAIRAIAPGVTPFGDGPDGGREAAFRGVACYPSTLEPWTGYTVIQCKYRQRMIDRRKDAAWVLDQLKQELARWDKSSKHRVKPNNYLFVTNVVLTPAARNGSKDRAFELLSKLAAPLGLTGFDIWDHDMICRQLDAHPTVRHAFAALITPSDVIAELLARPTTARQSQELDNTITLFLQRELRRSQYVRLEQAGLSVEQRTPLSRVFVDLPFSVKGPGVEPANKADKRDGIVTAVLGIGHGVLRPIVNPETKLTAPSAAAEPAVARYGRTVLIGGPGQGKSTAAQYACQLYRASLLRDRPRHLVSDETLQALDNLMNQCEMEGIVLPLHRRFPLHIVLERFAAALGQSDCRSLMAYIATQIQTATDRTTTADDLRAWLAAAPLFIVFDGLDEVPATSNRMAVLEQLQIFRDELALLGADVQILATTRPQGYSNEFSPEQYAHVYLTPLPRETAMRYAARLTDVKHAEDPIRKQEVLDRLAGALEEQATARLMQTPLQVTLMATLVEQIGEPPRERWRLFDQYYNAVYAREIERDIDTSRLLQGRRADVDAIHHRVGLLLQVEGEGPTQSRLAAELSIDRFGQLVRGRLDENGVEGSTLDDLAIQLQRAATDRLVFLVQPEQNRIGFEIRSLQEFAAAEALLTGREVYVGKRLAAIAAVPYWRNVFLFAAGRCFADTQHQHLREDILAICDELNANGADLVTSTTLEGARLALDILQDGVAREQPRYARWLAERAIKLLALPLDPTGADHSEILRLADAFYDDLTHVYREAVELRLNQKKLDHQLPAWALLGQLADDGVAWAVRLGNEHWPSDPTEQALIAAGFLELYKGTWTAERVIQSLPSWTPEQLKRVGSGDPYEVNSIDGPDWLRATAAGCWEMDFDEDGIAITPTYMPVGLTVGHAQVGGVALAPIASEWNKTVAPLLEMPGGDRRWALLQAGASFAVSPSHNSLAAALQTVADGVDSHGVAEQPQWFPWPLAVCLAAAASSDDLRALARSASAGDLGTVDDWLAAEARWERGIHEDDLRFSADQRLPLGRWIAEAGFPPVGILNPNISDASHFSTLYDLYYSLPLGRTRQQVAAYCFDFLNFFVQAKRGKSLASARANGVKFKHLTALFDDARHAIFHVAVVDMLKGEVRRSKREWIEFAERVGKEDAENGRFLTIDFETDRKWASSFPNLNSLVRALDREPQRVHLLNLLGIFAALGAEVTVPKHLFERYQEIADPSVRESLVLLALAHGKWDAPMISGVAKTICVIAADAADPGGRVNLFLEVIKHLSRTRAQREHLLLALFQQLSEMPRISREACQIIPILHGLLGLRVSLLQDSNKWKDLGLPGMPS